MQPLTIHLIPNAHLDPVWLWDWREGLNEGLATTRTVLALMDEFPELTFIRGEAAIYRHIERHDPESFRRIQGLVAAGRWDVVGGTYVQPDTNLPATETLARHFCRSQRYFIEKFGLPARVAWAADSFGHSAGLPEILAQAGMRGFAFTRPFPPQLALKKPAFWWEGAGGARVLAYRPPAGWYGLERDEIPRRLDAVLETARQTGLRTAAGFLGLGDHGGGPTRRHLRDVRAWSAQHPEVRVVYSGLHRLFDALAGEARGRGANFLPTHRGELNFCCRGCYASVAKFKFAYRRTEALLARAERTATAVSATLREPPGDLQAAWDALLFNSFHDILPGSSIERAYDEQLAWLGAAQHQARRVEFEALNALARRLDTSVRRPRGDHPAAVPFLVWNPHPHVYAGPIELEANLDYRPIWAYTGRPAQLPIEVRDPAGRVQPFQAVPAENSFMTGHAWRKRVVVPVKLPPMGWSVYTLGWVEGAKNPAAAQPAVPLTVTANVGGEFLSIGHGGPRRAPARARDELTRVSFLTLDDPWGAWGGLNEEPRSLAPAAVRHRWKISRVAAVERGPERSLLWVELTGGHSRIELHCAQYRNRGGVVCAARVLWNERGARLKLVLANAGRRAEFDVPGGSIPRGPLGEVPGGRWVKTERFGFASDAFYNFELEHNALRATIARASRYASDGCSRPNAAPPPPAVDAGELKFRFRIAPPADDLPRLARELEEPPVVLLVPAKAGKLPRSGSLLALQPDALRLLALKPAEDGRGFILRVQEMAGRPARGWLTWLGRRLDLGLVAGRAIATWRIGAGQARRTKILE